MALSWTGNAALIPEPESYFRGRAPPADFRLPSDLLLYFHDYSHAPTIVSSRHMLILPAAPMDYIVSGNRIPLKPGLALMVAPYLQRSVPDRGGRYDRLIVSFEACAGQPYLPAEPLMRVSRAAEERINRMVRCYLRREDLAAMFEAVLLLCELSRHAISGAVPALSPAVRQALGLINQSLVRPLSIKVLADAVGLSASHLRLIFRREMGMPLGAYMAERRLHAARYLLEDPTLSIGEIARRCGYDTIYTFSRFFRTRMGCSPSKFRADYE